MKLRKLMIVIEDNGADEGNGFFVYLTGDKERLGTIGDADMCPAEFWATKLFDICLSALKETGAIQTVQGAKTEGEVH